MKSWRSQFEVVSFVIGYMGSMMARVGVSEGKAVSGRAMGEVRLFFVERVGG